MTDPQHSPVNIPDLALQGQLKELRSALRSLALRNTWEAIHQSLAAAPANTRDRILKTLSDIAANRRVYHPLTGQAFEAHLFLCPVLFHCLDGDARLPESVDSRAIEQWLRTHGVSGSQADRVAGYVFPRLLGPAELCRTNAEQWYKRAGELIKAALCGLDPLPLAPSASTEHTADTTGVTRFVAGVIFTPHRHRLKPGDVQAALFAHQVEQTLTEQTGIECHAGPVLHDPADALCARERLQYQSAMDTVIADAGRGEGRSALIYATGRDAVTQIHISVLPARGQAKTFLFDLRHCLWPEIRRTSAETLERAGITAVRWIVALSGQPVSVTDGSDGSLGELGAAVQPPTSL